MLDPIGTIILSEGGYVDDPDDRGGPTKYGVTLRTYSTYMGRQATAADIMALDPETARKIFDAAYLKGPKIDEIPEPLRVQVLDMAINMGPGTAIKMLQGLLGIASDGVIGMATVSRVGDADLIKVNDELVDARIRRYRQIVEADPSQEKFLVGWIRRAEAFRLV